MELWFQGEPRRSIKNLNIFIERLILARIIQGLKARLQSYLSPFKWVYKFIIRLHR